MKMRTPGEEPIRPIDMTADYAALMALSIGDRSWEKLSARFLYCALSKDEDCPRAMYIMVRFLENFFSEQAVVALCDYSLSRLSNDHEFAEKFKSLRERITTTGSDLEPRLSLKLSPTVDPANVRAFFLACRVLVGHHGLALVHKTSRATVLWDSFDEYYNIDDFNESDKYREFLTATMSYSDDYVEPPPPVQKPVP